MLKATCQNGALQPALLGPLSSLAPLKPGTVSKGKGRGRVRTRFRNLAPVVDTFRTFCLSPTPEVRDLLLGIRQTGRLAGGVAAVTVRQGIDRPLCELQLRELREHAEPQGWQFADIYEDVSNGAKAAPALNRLMAGARARKSTYDHPLFSAGWQAAQHDSTYGMSFTPARDEGIDDRGRVKFEPAFEGQRGEAEAVVLQVQLDVV